MYTVRPRSVIPPIPFGLGVEMDHVIGSKWVINELYRLGFSISYNEVTRFKQNFVQNINVEDVILSTHPADSFTHWIADNVDHNIATIDGKHTFHGMGIVSATTGSFGRDITPREHTIPRQKLLKASEVVANKGVKIVQYISSSNPGLYTTLFKPLEEIHIPYTPPISIKYDLIWHSGYYFRNMSNMRPSWSGFMQDVNVGAYPSVNLLPIIDLNPSDQTCLYSTLLYIESQAKKLNITTPSITFDQPLWIKATDKSMNIVCRLGGFHTLMSFNGQHRHNE